MNKTPLEQLMAKEPVTIFQSVKVDRIVFHYNKAHNADPTIPTWIVKHKGETFYVNHLESRVGFTTKETPDNEHTKGALQFRGILKIVEENGTRTAFITSEV